MVKISARSIGLHRAIASIPVRPIIIALGLIKSLGFDFLAPDIVKRFSEDVTISTDGMRELLAVGPRRFESRVIAAIDNWKLEGAL